VETQDKLDAATRENESLKADKEALVTEVKNKDEKITELEAAAVVAAAAAAALMKEVSCDVQ
jgi:hypothetical protein